MSKTRNGEQAAAFINASKKNKDTAATDNTLYTMDTETTVKRNYRVNMAFDSDLKEFIKDASWKERKNVTQWLNDLVRAEMERAAQDPEY